MGPFNRALALCEEHREDEGVRAWGADAQACKGQLRHLLESMVLREVPAEPVDALHEQAAQVGRHPCHAAALDWHHVRRNGLDDRDPAAIAAMVAEGALSPLDGPTRFESAVVIRLVQALWERNQQFGGGCSCAVWCGKAGARWRRSSAMTGRGSGCIATSRTRTRGRATWGETLLRPHRADAARRDGGGREGGEKSAAVIEVKLTQNAGYVLQGFHEAMLYRWEYAEHLKAWPKAILWPRRACRGRPGRRTAWWRWRGTGGCRSKVVDEIDESGKKLTRNLERRG